MVDKTSPEWLNCTCPICGKRFHLKKYSVEKTKNQNCCSKECSREFRRTLMAGENNHQYGLKGDKNASWKSDRYINHYGYWKIRCLDHPFRDKQDFVLEHRLVAEQYLLNDENSVEIDGKRYLSPNYVVHHIDFNRLNNEVDNLVVMTKAEHQSLHTRLNPQLTDATTGMYVRNQDVLKAKKTTPTATLPTKATEGSAGWDLFVDTEEPVTIEAHSTKMFDTHIAMSIPRGYCGLIFARSGISTKRYLRPSTCVSVIDADYRGSVGLPMHNDSDYPQVVQPHERVAQLVLAPVIPVEVELVDSLDETDRGENGFGSTGT